MTALLMSYRRVGNGPQGLMWCTLKSPPRLPQSWQVQWSRINTFSRHSLYSAELKCLLRRDELPSIQLGCAGPTRWSLRGGILPAALTLLPMAARCFSESVRPVWETLMEWLAFFLASGVISCFWRLAILAADDNFARTSGRLAGLSCKLSQVILQDMLQNVLLRGGLGLPHCKQVS